MNSNQKSISENKILSFAINAKLKDPSLSFVLSLFISLSLSHTHSLSPFRGTIMIRQRREHNLAAIWQRKAQTKDVEDTSVTRTAFSLSRVLHFWHSHLCKSVSISRTENSNLFFCLIFKIFILTFDSTRHFFFIFSSQKKWVVVSF